MCWRVPIASADTSVQTEPSPLARSKSPWQRISPSIFAVLLVVVFSGLAAIRAFWFASGFPDEQEYWNLAKNLYRTGVFTLDGHTPSAYRPPLMAVVLLPLAAAGMNIETARAFFVLFYAATGCLCLVLLRRIAPAFKLLALLGSAFVLAHPLYFFSAGNLYPQMLLTPLYLAALALAICEAKSLQARAKRAAAIGFLAGASILAASSALFSFLPLFCLLVYNDFTLPRTNGKWRIQTTIAILVSAIVVAPYMYRNHANVHPGLYLSLNSGVNLLLGNSPGTTPTSGVDVDFSGTGVLDNLPTTEFELNQHYHDAAVRNIKSNPGKYLRLYLAKFVQGFSNSVVTFTHGRSLSQSALLWSYMAVVWCGVALLLMYLRRSNQTGFDLVSAIDTRALAVLTIVILASYLMNIAGYAVYFTRLRFRIPMDVALTLLSAAGWYLRLIGRRFNPAA